MTLSDLSASVLRISDIYAREHGIERDRDWALLKMQEELGDLADEAADVLGMLLIYCDRAGIDIEDAMRRKWLKWLEAEAA